MSTILDALKKSEHERKLNKLPTLTDMPAPQEPSRWPIYVGLALVMLAVSLVILAYVIWSSRPDVSQIQAAPTQSAISKSESSTEYPVEFSPDYVSLEVNVVSYSDTPAQRFAMVNAKLVREGEFIKPGIKISAILADAVVFNVRGEEITRRL